MATLEGEGGLRTAHLESYGAQVVKAQHWARTVGLLYSLSRFLALCSLTWATVVILGAFASSLQGRDFESVNALLLLEAIRLASALFFSHLLTRSLYYLPQDPRFYVHDHDGQYPLSRRLRYVSYIMQLIFILPSLILSGVLLRCPTSYPSGDTSNLQQSLMIFYAIVCGNCIVGLLHVGCFVTASWDLSTTPEKSILRYFDRVVENAMSSGVVQADEFDLFRFAYTMLAGEFRRNVQAEAVAKNHKELIRYLYYNRLGTDFLVIFLDDGDAFVRVAAANMVGFWADKTWGVGVEEETLALSEELLGKLAERVGTGQVGWAAASSVGVLARRPGVAQLIQNARTPGGQPVLDRLVDVIDFSSRALSLVRTLVRLYEQLSANECQPSSLYVPTALQPRLEGLAHHAKRHRLRVQAAYLLAIIGESLSRSDIQNINPTEDTYWFKSEKSMLQLLRGDLDLPLPDIREDDDIDPPSWLRPATQTEVV